jgi:hypothetical protein
MLRGSFCVQPRYYSLMIKLILAVWFAAPAFSQSFIYEDPAADQAIRHAAQATYNLDLVEARKTARSLQKSYPEHPVGSCSMPRPTGGKRRQILHAAT